MSILPTNDKERKMLPVFAMICGYFPKALREVTRVCVANNARYNPGREPADINWARGKSRDQLGSLFRHVLERTVDGTVFEDLPPEVQAACGEGFERVYVLAEAAWRALAALEIEIEEQECKKPFKQLEVAVPAKMCSYCGVSEGKVHFTWCRRNLGYAQVAVPAGTKVHSSVDERRMPVTARMCCDSMMFGPHTALCTGKML